MDKTVFQPGELVDQRVKIISVIGSGSMGYVYKAEQQGVERPVAVKALHRSRIADQDSIQRFLREARMISALHHENIVQVFSVSVTPEGQPYFIMEFLEGETLSAFARAGKLTSFKVLYEIFSQVCRGLAHAHEKGIVHRDLKPGNIMVSAEPDGRLTVKIVDFGIAKMIEQPEGQKLTRVGTIIGSPAYMSPEQCMGRALDARSDIYSLGCVMYETVTGLPPFTDSSASIFRMHIAEPAPPWDSKNIALSVPPELQTVILTALAKTPENRYQSADAMLEDLTALSEGRKAKITAGLKAKSGSTKPLVGKKQSWAFVTTCATIIFIGCCIGLQAANERRSAEIAHDLMIKGDRVYSRLFSIRCGHTGDPDDARWDEAIGYYERSSKGGVRLADLCLDRAQRYAERKKFEKSEQWFEKAYSLRQKYPRTGLGDLAYVEMEWGHECVAAGAYTRGQKLLETAYAKMKAQPEIDYKRMIILLNSLLIAYEKQGDVAAETAAYADLIKYQQSYESAPDIIATNMDHYADLLAATKRPIEAAQQRKLANEFRQKCTP